MKGIRSLGEQVAGALRNVQFPALGKDSALPVYLIHNSPDSEDYFFIFDFEDFVEQSRQGWFVRPKLQIIAGRSDFGRRGFARQFRESFAREFELARAELATREEEKRGWFGGLSGVLRDLAAPSMQGVLANLVLLVAVSAGTKVLSQILPVAWTRQKTNAQKLEDGISETRRKVDEALEQIDVTLHEELWRHAWRGQEPGRRTGMDYDAWPLPDYVRQHLMDGTSGSWW